MDGEFMISCVWEVLAMTEEQRKQRLADNTRALDQVQEAVYAVLKPHGFRKHGRLFHRFVEEDISQVVEFQRGQAYREETHLFWVNAGIRVPECQLRSFSPEEKSKKYYHEYECNMRWTLGEKSKKKTGEYDLRKPLEPIMEDILHRLETSLLPMFEVLSSRDAILEKRSSYPQLQPTHLQLLENAMIYGRRGELGKAAECFNAHYRGENDPAFAQRQPVAHRQHQVYLRELAEQLGITINENTPEA